MRECEWIEDFIDEDLDSVKRQAFELHLPECRHCREIIAQQAAIDKRLRLAWAEIEVEAGIEFSPDLPFSADIESEAASASPTLSSLKSSSPESSSPKSSIALPTSQLPMTSICLACSAMIVIGLLLFPLYLQQISTNDLAQQRQSASELSEDSPGDSERVTSEGNQALGMPFELSTSQVTATSEDHLVIPVHSDEEFTLYKLYPVHRLDRTVDQFEESK